jgi:site-specific recombinase XerC
MQGRRPGHHARAPGDRGCIAVGADQERRLVGVQLEERFPAIFGVLQACGINATAHQLRHYAGSSWYKASQHDLLTTARLLRHADVSSTQIYAQLDPTRPAEVVGLVPRLRLAE